MVFLDLGLNPSLLGHWWTLLPFWPKDFELWFITPKDFIPLLYWPVFVRLGLLRPFDIALFPQRWWYWYWFAFSTVLFLTANLPYRPASPNILPTVDVDILFHDIGSVVQRCLEQSGFCHASWWLWWNCPLLFLLLVYQPNFCFSLDLFPDVS